MMLQKCLLMTILLLFTTINILANEAGKELYEENLCHTCHGIKGKAAYPNYPNLAGHDALYIKNQFLDIQSKSRKNGLTLIMRSFPTVIEVEREDIEEIADYLSKLP